MPLEHLGWWNSAFSPQRALLQRFVLLSEVSHEDRGEGLGGVCVCGGGRLHKNITVVFNSPKDPEVRRPF